MGRIGGICAGVVLALCVAGCVGGPVSDGVDQFLSDRKVDGDPDPGHFDYCWDHSCNRVEALSLPPEAWSAIVRPLLDAPQSAVEERRHLREVVGAFETQAARLAGTSRDRGGTMTGYGEGGQLDCVDETANTTVLLVMLDKSGLLRLHRPGVPAGRGNLVDGLMPHRTAAIVETESGDAYAVDSWFHDNGSEPEVVEMSLWLAGWTPDEEPENVAAGVERPADR